MKKKVWIHIGMNKTGSTSIQNALYKSAENLKKRNIYYSTTHGIAHNENVAPVFLNAPEESLFALKKKLRGDDFTEKQSKLRKELIDEIESNDFETFVISAEAFCAYTTDEIEKLKLFFYTYFQEVNILVYVREIESWTNSAIQQNVKYGELDLSLNDIIEEYKNLTIPDTLTRILGWVDVFKPGNVTVRNFRKTCLYNQNAVEDFFQQIGASGALDKNNETFDNKSIDRKTFLVLTKYNELFPTIINGKLNPARAFNIENVFYPDDLFYIEGEKKFSLKISFTEEQAYPINELIRKFNLLLDDDCKLSEIEPHRNPTAVEEFSSEKISDEHYLKLINRILFVLEYYVSGSRWLEEQGNILKELNDSKENHISELTAYVSDLVKGKEWLEQQKASLDKSNTDKETYINELVRYINDLERGKTWLEEHRSILEKNNADKENYIVELKTYIDDLLKGKEWLEEQKGFLETQNYGREAQIGELKALVKTISETNEELALRIASLEEETGHKEKDLDQLRSDREALLRVKDENERQNNFLEKLNRAKQDEIDNLKSEIAERARKEELLLDQKNILEKQKSDKEEELDKLKQEIVSLNKYLEELKTYRGFIRNKIRRVK